MFDYWNYLQIAGVFTENGYLQNWLETLGFPLEMNNFLCILVRFWEEKKERSGHIYSGHGPGTGNLFKCQHFHKKMGVFSFSQKTERESDTKFCYFGSLE
jgi:hypothetical protein